MLDGILAGASACDVSHATEAFEPDETSRGLPAPTIFGTKMRTALLMLVAVLKETYPAELGRYLGTSVASVQRTLDKVEAEGLIATRPRVVRVVTLNPLHPAAEELRAFLLRLAQGYPQYRRVEESRRLRPRRRGKPS